MSPRTVYFLFWFSLIFVFGMFLLLVQLFQIFNCQLWSHGVEHQIIGVHGLGRSLRINLLARFLGQNVPISVKIARPIHNFLIILSISLYSLWTLVRKFFQKILFSRPLHPIVLRIQITGNSGTHELFHKIFTVVTRFPCKRSEERSCRERV